MTGWEPEVRADDTLVRQWVLASIERSCRIAERMGGKVAHTDAATYFDARSPLVLDNGVILRRPVAPHELPAIVSRARGFLPPERPWILLSAWPLPDLRDEGLELMGHPPFMARPPGPPATDVPAPEGVDIRRVTPELIDTFGAVLESSYPMRHASRSPWSDPRVLGDDLVAYLAYVDGEPVATSAAFIDGSTVDVEMISCAPEHRGRRIGEAMTWKATLAAPDRRAMLMASDEGRSLYERMGYLPVVRMTIWFRANEDPFSL